MFEARGATVDDLYCGANARRLHGGAKCPRAIDHFGCGLFEERTEFADAWQPLASVEGPLRGAQHGAAPEGLEPVSTEADGTAKSLLDGLPQAPARRRIEVFIVAKI